MPEPRTGEPLDPDARIAALEKSLRKAHIIAAAGFYGALASALLAVLLTRWTTKEFLELQSLRPPIVTTRVLALTDEEGNLRAHLGAFGNGRTELAIFGSSGTPVLRLGTSARPGEEDGKDPGDPRFPTLRIWDREGNLVYSKPE